MRALDIKNLKKTYKPDFEALKGIELKVEEGDFFALLGPNGAGKTTIIGIITSLITKSSGMVKVFGKDIDIEPNSAKKFIGVVPQEFNFATYDPVIEVVVNQAGYYGIDKKTAMKRAEKYLKQLELWDRRFDMSRNLSGGFKRRLMIARALIHEPKLLILDEPTAGVDVEIRKATWDFIKNLNKKGTTIILTTHYLEEAEALCKNIAIIDNGKIIENTSMNKLLKKRDLETVVLDTKKRIPEDFKMKEYEYRIVDDYSLEIDISKDQNINELFEILSKMKIEVLGMRSKSNRLERLFMSLVEGKKKK